MGAFVWSKASGDYWQSVFDRNTHRPPTGNTDDSNALSGPAHDTLADLKSEADVTAILPGEDLNVRFP